MKKKQVNPYDAQFDHLHKELSGVKDIEKLLDSEAGQRFLEFIATRQYEVNGLIQFYKKVIIPAVNRNIVEQTKLWKQSRYSKVVQLTDSQLREDKYMIIRMAYVQLYHRYESFINELLKHCEQMGGGTYPSGVLYEYIKTTLGLDLKRHTYHPTLKEVNYVANCVKHTNGLPTRGSTPERFKELDKTLPIRIPDVELYKDMESIRNLMAKLIEHVLRAHQLLLYKDIANLVPDVILKVRGIAAVGLLETALKLEFLEYKTHYQSEN